MKRSWFALLVVSLFTFSGCNEPVRSDLTYGQKVVFDAVETVRAKKFKQFKALLGERSPAATEIANERDFAELCASFDSDSVKWWKLEQGSEPTEVDRIEGEESNGYIPVTVIWEQTVKVIAAAKKSDTTTLMRVTLRAETKFEEATEATREKLDKDYKEQYELYRKTKKDKWNSRHDFGPHEPSYTQGHSGSDFWGRPIAWQIHSIAAD